MGFFIKCWSDLICHSMHSYWSSKRAVQGVFWRSIWLRWTNYNTVCGTLMHHITSARRITNVEVLYTGAVRFTKLNQTYRGPLNCAERMRRPVEHAPLCCQGKSSMNSCISHCHRPHPHCQRNLWKMHHSVVSVWQATIQDAISGHSVSISRHSPSYARSSLTSISRTWSWLLLNHTADGHHRITDQHQWCNVR